MRCTGRQVSRFGWLPAAVLATAMAAAVAEVPKAVGPRGLLLWESPRAIPELAFEDAQGNPLTVADFHGKVVLLNIWATWCPPCRAEMPMLDRLQAELGGPEFEVVALSVDKEGIGVVQDYFKENDLQHLGIYIDRTGSVVRKLGVIGIPTTLLLDRQGGELGRLVGAIEWDSPDIVGFLRNTIEQTRSSKR